MSACSTDDSGWLLVLPAGHMVDLLGQAQLLLAVSVEAGLRSESVGFKVGCKSELVFR